MRANLISQMWPLIGLLLVFLFGVTLTGRAEAGERELIPMTKHMLNYLVSLEENGEQGLWEDKAAQKYLTKLKKIFNTKDIQNRLDAAVGVRTERLFWQSAFKTATNNHLNVLAHTGGGPTPETELPLWESLSTINDFPIVKKVFWTPFMRNSILMPICATKQMAQYILFSPLFDAAVRFSINSDLEVEEIGLATGDTLRGKKDSHALPNWVWDKEIGFTAGIGHHASKTVDLYTKVNSKNKCASYKNRQSDDVIVLDRIRQIIMYSIKAMKGQEHKVVTKFLHDAKHDDLSTYGQSEQLKKFLQALGPHKKKLFEKMDYLSSIHNEHGYIHIFAVPNFPLVNLILVNAKSSKQPALHFSLITSTVEK